MFGSTIYKYQLWHNFLWIVLSLSLSLSIVSLLGWTGLQTLALIDISNIGFIYNELSSDVWFQGWKKTGPDILT